MDPQPRRHRERRWADADETVVEMSVAAGGKALAASGLSPEDVDLVVVASCSLPTQIPGAGPEVAHRLGIPRPGGYDVNAGCAGFCYALSAASDAIRAGSARHALVIGVEKLTDVVDMTDRSTAVIFADGAGAMVIGASDEPGVGPVVWGSDGDQRDAIAIPPRPARRRQPDDGRPGGLPLGHHQAHRHPAAGDGPRRGHRRRHRRLRPAPGQPADHRADGQAAGPGRVDRHRPRRGPGRQHLVRVGAARPLALLESGEAKSGDLALLLGYGAGLTFAGQVVRLP